MSGRAVRRGSIAAMRLYVDILELDRLRGTPKPEDPLAFADELAAKRAQRPEASWLIRGHGILGG